MRFDKFPEDLKCGDHGVEMEFGTESNVQDNWMGKVFVDVEWNSERLDNGWE